MTRAETKQGLQVLVHGTCYLRSEQMIRAEVCKKSTLMHLHVVKENSRVSTQQAPLWKKLAEEYCGCLDKMF